MLKIQFERRNIFEHARYRGLTAIYGHIGFNQMRESWVVFSQAYPQLALIDDPFHQIDPNPFYLEPEHLLYFVPEPEDGGMTDEALVQMIRQLFLIARDNQLARIAFNGAPNIVHGYNYQHNLASDDIRTRLLVGTICAEYTAQVPINLSFFLTSLSNVFLRNFPRAIRIQ